MRFSSIRLSNIYLALLVLAVLCLFLAFSKVDKIKYSIFKLPGRHAIFGGQDANAVVTENDRSFVYPIAGFTTRITQKPFGMFISPANSPIKPEKYSGFHSGVDVEYRESKKAVPVYAIGPGEIFNIFSAPGLGGTLVLKTKLGQQDISIIYSHLKLTSLKQVGIAVKKGEIIAYLGEGGTSDTDGERKHLHFGISKNLENNKNEYVQTESELQNWIDPKVFFSTVIQ